MALKLLPLEPFNLVTDSLYCANALRGLSNAFINTRSSPIASQLATVQALLFCRPFPIYVLHVRSHTSTSGPIFQGNDVVDHAFLCPLQTEACNAHSKYHLSARSLRHLYGLTKEEAQQIVKRCDGCAPFCPPPRDIAVNPRGDKPNALWQMDVTHLGHALIHVSIDTYSGFLFATVQPGEAARHVTAHLLCSFAYCGVPSAIKTENGPAYTSRAFALFCQEFAITHITGIPYNPTGQAIVERANRTLKTLLLKQKGGVGGRLTQGQLAQAVYTYNFLQFREDHTTPALCFYAGTKGPMCPSIDAQKHKDAKTPQQTSPKTCLTGSRVMWRDPEGQGQGPGTVTVRGQGHLCVLPDGDASTEGAATNKRGLWVPTEWTVELGAEAAAPTPSDLQRM